MSYPARRPVVLALLAAFVLCLPVRAQERPRNVILFISDGAGPAVFTLARDYTRDYLGTADHLALDEILVGAVRTYSSDSRTTDSAASATAYATGHKTYNGAVSVDTLRRPLPTVLEAAEARGLATGLVATSSLTHATPAAFSAHVPDRGMQYDIAARQAVQGVDVLFGGGRNYYMDPEAGGTREDGRNLAGEMAAAGYTVVTTRDAFEDVRQTPVLGLFAANHMAYDIDRDTLVEPSLAEMTRRAIDLLAGDPDGFFLMVEGSRIDHAAHQNDVAGVLHDALAYDRAVAAALDFARRDGATLVVSVSDHETGGLTLGRRDGATYGWQPAVVARLTTSGEVLRDALHKGDRSPAVVLKDLAGIDDLTSDEARRLERTLQGDGALDVLLGEIVGRRASIGWTTGGHTAVDVNLYAFGPGSRRLRGNHENTDLGRVVADLLRLDLAGLRTE